MKSTSVAWLALACGVVCGLACGSARAQLVVPPGDAPPANPPLVLPPWSKPAETALSKTEMPRINVPDPMAKAKTREYPNVPYDSIVKRDDKGKLIRLTEPAPYVALKANPLIKDNIKDKVSAYLAQRRVRFERTIIDNLDLVEELDGPGIDNLKIGTKDPASTKVLNSIKVLRPPGAPDKVQKELEAQQILSSDQALLNEKIERDYEQAIAAEPMEGDKQAGAMDKVKSLLKYSVHEPMWIYHKLLLDVSQDIGAAAQAAGLPSEAVQQAKAAGGAIVPGANDQDRVAAVRDFAKTLTLEQRQALYRAVAAKRAK